MSNDKFCRLSFGAWSLPSRICMPIIAVLLAVFLWNCGARSLQENLFYLTLLAFLPLQAVLERLLHRGRIKDWLAGKLPDPLLAALPMNLSCAIIFALLLSEKGDSAAQVMITWLFGVPLILSLITAFNLIALKLGRS